VVATRPPVARSSTGSSFQLIQRETTRATLVAASAA